MKKLIDLIKPFLSIVLGALVILLFLNGLSDGGTDTAKAVFALIVGAYFITIGVIKFVAGNKIDKKVLDILSAIAIASYAVLFFVVVVCNMADFASEDIMKQIRGYGTNGWIIALYSVVISAGFAAVYLVAYFVKNEVLNKVSNLLGLLFLLALVLNVLFSIDRGDPVQLGDIVILAVVTHSLFGYIYLASVGEEKVLPRRPHVRPIPRVEEEEAPVVEE